LPEIRNVEASTNFGDYVEHELRAKFAEIGIAPGKDFDFSKLSDAQKAELAVALKEGFDEIDKASNNIGKNVMFDTEEPFPRFRSVDMLISDRR
jgi:hypothetical protein